MRDDATFPRAWIVIALAGVGSALGLVLAAAITLQRQGVLGDPDSPTRMIAEHTWVLAWSGFAASVGWTAGVLLGWRLMRHRTPPSVVAAWALRVLAVGLAAVAALGIIGLPSAADLRRSSSIVEYDISTLTWVVVLFAAIGIGTLLLLARRTSPQPAVVVGGVALAVVALIAGGLRVGALPSPDRAWLERWLITRQAPLGAASNLIEPASARCDPRSPDPFPRENRSFSSDVPSGYYWVNPWAPRWLPEGFGLAMDQSWPWPQPHGVWTDARCREITLFMRSSRDAVVPLEEGLPDVAGWSRTPAMWCAAGAECLEYRAIATIRDSKHETLVVLRTVGLSRAEGDRVVRSIPTDRVAYV